MRLLRVNIGKAEPVPGAKDPYLSGIAKKPVEGPVAVTAEGVAGDSIGDSRYHGGPDQAAYLYGRPDYIWWEESLGRELPLAPLARISPWMIGNARIRLLVINFTLVSLFLRSLDHGCRGATGNLLPSASRGDGAGG